MLRMADVLSPVVMSSDPSIPPPLMVGTVMLSAKVGERYKTTFSVPVDWVTPVPPFRTGRIPVMGGETDG